MLGSLSQLIGVFQSALDFTGSGSDKVFSERELELMSTNGSITKLLGKYVVTPTILVSKNLRGEEAVDDLIRTNINIFAAFYAQAFTILAEVQDMRPSAVFDILSSGSTSSRSIVNSLKRRLDESSLSHGTEALLNDELDFLPINGLVPGIEATYKGRNGGSNSNNRNNKFYRDDSTHNEYSKGSNHLTNYGNVVKNSTSNTKTINEAVNKDSLTQRFDKRRYDTVKDKDSDLIATISKEINITVRVRVSVSDSSIETREIIVPVIIKANVIFTDFENITNMIDTRSDSHRFGTRLEEYLSTEINFKDFMLASDLIAKYKKNKIKDKDDVINLLNHRTHHAKRKAAVHFAAGFQMYYGMLIIDNDQKKIIDGYMNGDIVKREKFKEKLMEESASLLVSIVDQDYERVTILTKDITGNSDIPFKSLKAKGGKSDSSDMSEIFKAMVNNKPPLY
jgi:hypothetical protein